MIEVKNFIFKEKLKMLRFMNLVSETLRDDYGDFKNYEGF